MLIDQLMNQIVSDVDTHARWLNTLSYLEYIGFRKIVKSQPASMMTQATLLHANEEGRHALLLKNISLKVGGDKFDSYRPETLLCGEPAEEYFQSVDAGAEMILSEIASNEKLARLTYFAVTWLVELRALEVYGAYTQALNGIGMASPLASLLKEEERHLKEVTEEIAGLLPDELRDRLIGMEQIAYLKYLRALELNLKGPQLVQAH
jgi:hypothetical protein